MCIGSIARLVETWDADGVRVGRLGDGCVVSLSFVPDAEPGSDLLLHLGIPVEVLDRETARDALELRAAGQGGDPR
jgi:hydrogenase maturation factor